MGESGLLEDGTRYINYLFNKGLGIGWHEDDSKTTHLKTFISHDTLTRQQKAIADVLKNNEAQDVDIRIPEIHLKNKLS